jgi:hypothetical protein
VSHHRLILTLPVLVHLDRDESSCRSPVPANYLAVSLMLHTLRDSAELLLVFAYSCASSIRSSPSSGTVLRFAVRAIRGLLSSVKILLLSA